jgi:hypothetical protein
LGLAKNDGEIGKKERDIKMNEILYKIGIAYNNWYKTKDPKYKDEWYELIEQFDEEYNKNALQR